MQNFIHKWLEAWTGNHPEKLLSFYHQDAFYADPHMRGGLKGKEAMKAYFSKLLARNPDWIWKALEIIPTEKGCTLKWQAQIPTSKGIVECTGLDIVEIENGLIMRNEVFFDPSPLKVG